MTLTSINPATGITLKRYAEADSGQVGKIIINAGRAFDTWRRMPVDRRAVFFWSAAEVLRDNKMSFSRLMAEEMGKPIADGRAEVEKCAWVCEYYAEHAKAMLASETVTTDAAKSYVAFRPLGIILGIMPWNYPFWQVFRFAVPTLMAGNTVLLKHAANVSGCLLAMEEVFKKAGLGDHVFQALLVSGERVAAVIEHPLVAGISLTGSTKSGRAVAAAAAKQMKKVVLELGGSDPYLILEDADIPAAVAACVTSRLLNSGQSCIAAKRFIVVENVRPAFEAVLVEALARVKMGDPLDETVRIGPQARADLRDDLHRQVRQSMAAGARCLLGGEIPEGPGFYYPPTVLTDVAPGMPAFDEETFGPVAAVVPAADAAHAVQLANDSSYGLGAAVFTADARRGERIAREELQAGTCCVNTYVRSDPRLPFGGIKQSGLGRELSHYGIKEFVNIKTVYME